MSSLRYYWKTSNVAIKLIIVNAFVFLSFNILGLFFHLMKLTAYREILFRKLALPAFLPDFILQPWSLLSHMFMHQGLLHIFFNMLLLYFGGRLFLYYLDEKKLVNVYFLAGLSGALLYMIAVNVFPLFSESIQSYYAVGASAACLGVFIAICAYRPHDKVQLLLIGGVKLMWVGIVMVILDIVNLQKGNEGGHIAHFGGELFGYLFGLNMRKYKDISKIFQPVQDFFMQKRKVKVQKTHLRKVYVRKTDEQFNEEKAVKQRKMDAILDKIKISGYANLSSEEKRFLSDMSKEL